MSRRKETAAERDERIVAEAGRRSAWQMVSPSIALVGTGAPVTEEDLRACAALVRIANRLSRQRRPE